jgi:membrane-associated phospholipid phosphatase
MAVSDRQPIDRVTLAYAALSGAVLVTRLDRLAHAPLVVLAHALVVLVAVMAPRLRRAGAVGAFVGAFYPLLLTVALYTEIGLLNVARGVVHDAVVQRWEQSLFGLQPSRDWIRAWPSPAASTLLHAAYLSYYLILAAAPLGLWLHRQRDDAARVLLLMMSTFYLCYAVFLLFPVAGPRYLYPLADNAATRTALARATQRLLDNGAAWGTAFPSSHVAVSLVAAGGAFGAWRALGAVLVPAAVLLTLGTVYGQLHYAVDALAGVAVAAAVLLGARLATARKAMLRP